MDAENLDAVEGLAAEREASNRALYDRIRSGDKAAINEMIEANMERVDKLLEKRKRKHEKFCIHEDDLRSVGYVKLVNVVQRFAGPHKEPRDIGKYLNTAIGRAIDGAADESELVGPGADTQRKARRSEEGEPFAECRPIKTGFDGDGRCDYVVENGRCVDVPAVFDDLTPIFDNILDREEKWDKIDRLIFWASTSGYTDQEIAEKLNLTERTVYNRRAKIARLLDAEQRAAAG